MSTSSTPPDQTKFMVPTIVLWGWLGASVMAVITLAGFLLHLAFDVDHRIIQADSKAGSGISDAKQSHDLGARNEGRIDSLEKRVQALEIWCAPRPNR